MLTNQFIFRRPISWKKCQQETRRATAKVNAVIASEKVKKNASVATRPKHTANRVRTALRGPKAERNSPGFMAVVFNAVAAD
jgi:hypothetical protein